MTVTRRCLAVILILLNVWIENALTQDDGHVNELDGDPQILKNYLERNNYLSASVLGTSDDFTSLQNLTEAIIDLQIMVGLDPTGEVDDLLMSVINVPRCGMPDNIPEDYRAASVKYDSPHLTYRIDSFTRTMEQADVRMIIRDALQLWAAVTPLTFTEVFGETRADIDIAFVAGAHGDVASFDGPGGVLAHAFLPRNSDTHFDLDEEWTMGTFMGINLFQIAAHEFGHALGLYHSNDMSALMFPYYHGYQANLQLGEDDIEGIQSLYGDGGSSGGSNGGTSGEHDGDTDSSAEMTTQSPSTPSILEPPAGACHKNGTFDAVVNTKDGRTYGLIGQYVWRLDVFPRTYSSIDQQWPGLPNFIGAAITEGDTTYFLKRCFAWQFENQEFKGRIRVRDKWPALPCNVNAGYVSPSEGYTYFFKGQFVYRYQGNRFMFRIRINSLNYQGLPARNFRVTAINPNFNDNGEPINVYIFSGNLYYLFDDVEKRFVFPTNYPRHVAKYILNSCSSSY